VCQSKNSEQAKAFVEKQTAYIKERFWKPQTIVNLAVSCFLLELIATKMINILVE